MAFQHAGKNPGIEVWRIEDFEAVPYSDNSGKFYSGDSYIILSTFLKFNRLHYDVHFWLGDETSQDESGTAAFKAVELDDSLGGAPIQHREVQNHESSLFLSYFKNGVKYLPGGIKSGFKHVDAKADAVKRLFIIQGKRNIKVRQVEFSPSSMNNSDAFILDGGKEQTIYVYQPPGSSRMERFKAIAAANAIRDEDHAGDAVVEIIDETSDKAQEKKFFEELGGGSKDTIAETAEVEEEVIRPVKLFHVDGDGKAEVDITEIASGKTLTQDMLDTDDCYIIDTGCNNGILAWVGKKASKEEKNALMKFSEEFLAKNNLPKWTNITRIVEGTETTLFKQYFKSWHEQGDAVGLGRAYPVGSIAEWDVGSLHAETRRKLAKSAGAAIGFMPDDAKGEKEIFRIENLEMVPLEKSKYGMFFGGDSYVIKYSYEGPTGRAYIVYYWQGSQSSQDEKAASALHAVKIDDELHGKAIQIRVTQGSEPRHFIKMFDCMIVFAGGKASGFKNWSDHDTYDVDGTELFRIRGTCSEDITAVQVEEKAASLNSDDVFILETPTNVWIWVGEAADDNEVGYAKYVVEYTSEARPFEIIKEGSEPAAFWKGLGGKGDYTKQLDLNKPILEPRLFHCVELKSGNVSAREMFNFTKKDLVTDDIMILDSGDEVYVWVGAKANDNEKQKSLEMAKKYLDKDPTERDQTNSLILTIKEGQEPSSFTCIFPSWK